MSSIPVAAPPQLSVRAFLIDEILPCYEVSLIGGPSGAGKTSWQLQILEDWTKGLDVLGYTSHPAPFCFVACDRSVASSVATLERVGVTVDGFPLVSCVDAHLESQGEVHEAARQLVPDLKVLFIDGFATLIPGGRINDYRSVARFLKDWASICKDESLTVIGTVHSTKVHENERFLNPRQRVLGSVAWAAFSETIILVEPIDPQNPIDDRRSVTILPRNSRAVVIEYVFDQQGRLVEAGMDAASLRLDKHLEPLKGKTFTSREAVEWGEGQGLDERTVYRWLKQRLEDGRLSKAEHGIYLVLQLT